MNNLFSCKQASWRPRLLAAIVLCLSFGVVLQEALAQSSVYLQNGIYTIKNQNSGLLLDVKGDSQSPGADIDQWPATGGNNQNWILNNLGNNYIALTSVNSSQELDVSGAQTTPGATVDQYTYNGNNNQIWQLVPEGNGFYELLSKNGGRSLRSSASSSRPRRQSMSVER